MDADEVTIGRRYYRSGESEYTINGQNVRLKTSTNCCSIPALAAMATRLSAQGRIAEIVAAKSNERREIFEEASGIARFRYRKNEAERRLAAAEGNLERLRDILGELEGRVGPLKRDSEKAQKFLEYSATANHSKSPSGSIQSAAHRKLCATSSAGMRPQNRTTAGCQNSLTSSTPAPKPWRAEAQKLMLDVEQANADIRALTEAGAGRDSALAVLRNENEHARAQIGRGRGRTGTRRRRRKRN